MNAEFGSISIKISIITTDRILDIIIYDSGRERRVISEDVK